MFPYCDPADRKNPEVQEKWRSGPLGTLTVWLKAPNMGLDMACSFSFYVVVGVFVAYLGTIALQPGAGFKDVFRLTSTAAILAYSFGHIPNAIWFRKTIRSTLNEVLDGVAYGLLTGVVFASLWPASESLVPGVGG